MSPTLLKYMRRRRAAKKRNGGSPRHPLMLAYETPYEAQRCR